MFIIGFADLFEEYRPALGPDPVQILSSSIRDIREKPELYYRCLAVVGSPGSGKSKNVLKLGEEIPLVYLLCDSKQIQNGMKASPNPVVTFMLRTLREAQLQNRQKIAFKIVESIRAAAAEFDTPGELAKAHWAEDHKMNGPLFDSIGKHFKILSDNTPDKLKVVSYAADAHYYKAFPEESPNLSVVSHPMKSALKEVSPEAVNKVLVIAFDEAYNLGEEVSELQGQQALFSTPLRTLQRAINDSSVNRNIFGLFLSTSCNYSRLVPGHTSSHRVTDQVDPPLVLGVLSFDVFGSKDEWLFFGRPLWRQVHNYQDIGVGGENKMMMMIRFASRMLTNELGSLEFAGHDKCAELNVNTAAAIFCCRISMNIISSKADVLTSHHMGNMISELTITGKRIKKVVYYSEPALVEASSWLTSYRDAFSAEKIVTCLFLGSDNIVDYSKGDLGEIVAIASILYTLDNIRRNNFKAPYDPSDLLSSFSAPVSVLDLLRAFSCQVDPSLFKTLRDYEVLCNHFVRVPKVDKNTCTIALERHAGIICRSGQKALDFVVLMKHKTSGLVGHIAGQVKNYYDGLSDASVDEILLDMHLMRNKVPEIFKDSLCVKLVLAVGKGAISPIVRIDSRGPRLRSQTSDVGPMTLEVATHLKDFCNVSQELKSVLLQVSSADSSLYHSSSLSWPARA